MMTLDLYRFELNNNEINLKNMVKNQTPIKLKRWEKGTKFFLFWKVYVHPIVITCRKEYGRRCYRTHILFKKWYIKGNISFFFTIFS